jgi:hypothetical protein
MFERKGIKIIDARMKNIVKGNSTKVILIALGVLFVASILVGIPMQMVMAIHKAAAIIWEEKNLSHGIDGYVLEAHGNSLVAFDLNNKSAHIVKAVPKESFSDGWRIFDVTGPSRDGKIIYLLTNPWNKQTNSWDDHAVCACVL